VKQVLKPRDNKTKNPSHNTARTKTKTTPENNLTSYEDHPTRGIQIDRLEMAA